jgi:hypothetical protein
VARPTLHRQIWGIGLEQPSRGGPLHPPAANHPIKEAEMKTILAAILAGTFLVSLPLRAEDKPAGEKTEKAEKGKKDKKGDKKEDKGAAKSGGGGW